MADPRASRRRPHPRWSRVAGALVLLAGCGADPVPFVLLGGCGADRPVCGIAWSTGARDPSVPLSVEQTRFADATGPARLLGARPVTLTVPDGTGASAVVTVNLERPDGITILDADGVPVTLPLEVAVCELPLTLYVEGTATRLPSEGAATLTATVPGCEIPALALSVVPVAPLAGRTREEAPGFGYDDTFALGEPLEVAFDRHAQPDGLGEARAWVVPHRTLAAWAAAPALVDVTGAVDTLPLGDEATTDLADAGHVVWDAVEPDPGAFGGRYDVVLDLDGDSVYSPGDRLDQGGDGEGLRVAGDLAAAGPHPVSQVDVLGGDWLGQRVYWPDDLADLGPRPLVVISHGNGHQYDWYDYLGQHLASWGYVVMAHENDTMPGIETASTTTLTNTEWLLTHLDEVGGGALVGLVDAERIAWIGHSRGGEGVVRAYTRLLDGDDTPAGYDADAIRVIASIAPTVFNPVTISDPDEVRFHLLAGASDGDVTGSPEAPAAQSFRLYQAAYGTRSSTYVYGASHEDFNCCGADDGRGPDQLEREDAQTIAKAYLLAVVAEGVDDDVVARALLTRDPMRVPATAFATTVAATWRPAEGLVIDDYQLFGELMSASSNAAVGYDVTNAYEGDQDDADTVLTWDGEDPMNGMTQADGNGDQAKGIVFDWQTTAFYGYDLPSSMGDWREQRYLSLNACQGTRHPITEALDGPLTFSVTLLDGAGVAVTRSIAPHAEIAPPYARALAGDGRGWSNSFSTVRVPLVDFTAGGTGLDLGDIQAVTLEFGGDADSGRGRLGLDDVEVVR